MCHAITLGSAVCVCVLTLSMSWASTCMSSCCLLDPVWLHPLVEDVLHAAILQYQSWQRMQRGQLLQSGLVCGVVCFGAASACTPHLQAAHILGGGLSGQLICVSACIFVDIMCLIMLFVPLFSFRLSCEYDMPRHLIAIC